MKKLVVLAMILLVMGLVACGAENNAAAADKQTDSTPPVDKPATQEDLVNIVWQWSDLTETEPAGQSVIPDSEKYTVTFLPDGTASIKADCNRISWPYTIEGNKITFNALFATTLAACPPGSLGDQFVQNLAKTQSAELQNGRLILNLTDGGQMGFINGGSPSPDTPSADNPISKPPFDTIVPNFVGKTWEWEKFQDTAEENDITVSNPQNYSIRFNPDGTANIKADCNQLNWTYELDGAALTFNTLGATTLALCPEGSLDQQFLKLLGNTAAYVAEDNKLVLNLQADAGNMVFRQENAETAVSGAITTDQPSMLHEDAIIQVQIQNTSEADGPADVIGEQILEAAGAQFPILYKVGYDRSDVDDRFTYSMGVRITDSSGKLLYISDTATPVITNGFPTSDVIIEVVPVN